VGDGGRRAHLPRIDGNRPERSREGCEPHLRGVTVADGDDMPTATDLRDHLRARLAPHKTPMQWYRAEQFPANAMGKLQKFRVKDAIMAGELTRLAP
jgi:acyl-coenzyme A synthetase/AMP-(fatty) acid ligase